MKNVIFVLFLILLTNCKSIPTKIESKNTIVEENKTTILKNIDLKKIDFKTMVIKSSVKFEDENQSQRVSVDIRIKKDEIIWVNVKLLGIPIAKALITPDKVQFYEKLNNTYFDGDFSVISNLLGTELNFEKTQNMVLGLTLEKINTNEYNFSLIDQLCFFNSTTNNFEKTFAFETQNFALKKQYITQNIKNEGIKIDYLKYQNIENKELPEKINIIALRKKGNANIDIEYNSIILNEELNFNYSVPNGYKLRNL